MQLSCIILLTMDELSKILNSLKKAGFKETKIRKALIKILLSAKSPLTAFELQVQLQSQGLQVNKSTIYRELDFLKNQRIVKEIQFGEGKKRYEIEGENHHHHVICIQCNRVEDVKLERELDEEEQKIYQAKSFKVLNHSLEFFGLCRSCR